MSAEARTANEGSRSVGGLRPGNPLHGTFEPTASKSLAQRALLCAGFSGGTAYLSRLAPQEAGEDVLATIAFLRALQAGVEILDSTTLRIEGLRTHAKTGWRPPAVLEVGESATLARFATAVCAFSGAGERPVEISGRGTLLARSSPPLFAALQRADVACEFLARPDGWPVRLRPRELPPALELAMPISSQEVSALLFALASWPKASSLRVLGPIPSRPYLDLTLAVLRRFGARVHASPVASGDEFVVEGPLRAPRDPLAIEPDASSAAVAAAAACITGGALKVLGLDRDSLQGDVKVAKYLAHFGCSEFYSSGQFVVAGPPTTGATLDLSGEPDLAPVLAAVGAAVALRAQRAAWQRSATTLLTGIAALQHKESPRIEVLARGLRQLGLVAEAGRDSLRIAPGAQPTPAPTEGGEEPVVLDPADDHRMAFAFALLGLVRDRVDVADSSCVAKSWPGFWRDLERLGASVMLRAP
jgi:3-phosphoshikimate 1-carboxyvinyltransferase